MYDDLSADKMLMVRIVQIDIIICKILHIMKIVASPLAAVFVLCIALWIAMRIHRKRCQK